MTLGQFLRGCVLQGNVHVAYWGKEDSPVEEEWFEYQDGSHKILSWAKEHKLLSKKVYWVFCQAGYLNIEVNDEY